MHCTGFFDRNGSLNPPGQLTSQEGSKLRQHAEPVRSHLRQSGIGALAALLLVCGCSVSNDFVGKDESVFFPAGRVTFHHAPDTGSTLRGLHYHGRPAVQEPDIYLERDSVEGDYVEGPAPVAAPVEHGHGDGFGYEASAHYYIEGSSAIDLSFNYGHADIADPLAAGESVRVGDTFVSGPGRIGAEIDFYTGSVVERGGFWIHRIVAIEGIVGLGVTYVDFDLTRSGAGGGNDTWSVGPLGGAQLTVRPLDWLSFYARGTYYGGLADSSADFVELGTGELGFELMPLPGLSIFAGWHWEDYDEERRRESDLELELSGPVVGLHLTL